MIKDFYISIIPIGNVNWHDKVKSLIFTTKLNDTSYKAWRMFETLDCLKDMRLDHLPVFIPNEAINLKDDIKFRITVSYPISDKDISVLTPWTDEEMSYNDACWLCMEKIIEHSSYYTVILTPSFYGKDVRVIVDKVIEVCDRFNRPYTNHKNNDTMIFNNIYKYFNNMEGDN